MLRSCSYYWTITQIEYSTDVLFKSRDKLAGGLTLLEGAGLVFDPTGALNVLGNVLIDNSFGVASFVDVNGLAITDWSSISAGTYALIGITTSKFDNIQNLGPGNAAPLGDGRLAYFQNGSLQIGDRARAGSHRPGRPRPGRSGMGPSPP